MLKATGADQSFNHPQHSACFATFLTPPWFEHSGRLPAPDASAQHPRVPPGSRVPPYATSAAFAAGGPFPFSTTGPSHASTSTSATATAMRASAPPTTSTTSTNASTDQAMKRMLQMGALNQVLTMSGPLPTDRVSFQQLPSIPCARPESGEMDPDAMIDILNQHLASVATGAPQREAEPTQADGGGGGKDKDKLHVYAFSIPVFGPGGPAGASGAAAAAAAAMGTAPAGPSARGGTTASATAGAASGAAGSKAAPVVTAAATQPPRQQQQGPRPGGAASAAPVSDSKAGSSAAGARGGGSGPQDSRPDMEEVLRRVFVFPKGARDNETEAAAAVPTTPAPTRSAPPPPPQQQQQEQQAEESPQPAVGAPPPAVSLHAAAPAGPEAEVVAPGGEAREASKDVPVEELPDAFELVRQMYGEEGLEEIREEVRRHHGGQCNF